MGLAYIEGAGGGGVRSSDVTANAADILSGKRDLTSTSDDEVVQGTMPNNGAVNQTLGINGSYTIPAGYHNGSGKVKQSVTTKGAATYYATTSDQTIAANQWLSGAQTIKKLTQTNLSGGNIKPGVTVTVNNGNTNVFSVTGSMASKGAATYYPTTSDQTIAANQYLTGVQTIKAVSQQNLVAGNIKKGVTVYVKNGSGNIFAVTGTWEGYVPATTDLYYRGTYGQYGALDFYVSKSDYVALDSGQISFHTGNLNARSLSVAFITPVTVNMSSYSKLYLEGSLAIASSGANQYVASCNCYVDLLDSRPSTSSAALNVNNYYLRLASRSQSEHAYAWGNYTFSWSKQNATKYIRVLFTGEPSGAYLEISGAWYRMQLQ